MRVYEELFIVRSDAPEEEIDAHIEQIKQIITNAQGAIDKVDKWGVRRLAYPVQKRRDGYYVLIQFSADAGVVKEVERRMRVADLVMKFITVRIDEKLKKQDKRKKQREKRAKRKPPPTVAAPLAPGAAPAAPAGPAVPAPGLPEQAAAPAPAATPAPVAPETPVTE